MRSNSELRRSAGARKETSTRKPPAADSEVSIVDDGEGFAALAPEWDSLLAQSQWPNPAMHVLWARTFVNQFQREGRLQVLVARDSSAAAIGPLTRSPGFLGRLSFLGQAELYEAMDFIYPPEADLAPLAEALVRLGRPLSLGSIPADSPAVAALKRAYRRRALIVLRPNSSCPWIALDDNWTDPERHVNAGRRSDLRRARKHAEKLGSVTYEILAPAPHELEPLLHEAMQVETESWKGREGTSLLEDAALGEFFRRYAAAACEQGLLRLCFLRIGGQAAAMQFAIESGERFWLLKIGYSDRFARCSPGVLLMIETIRYAARKGLRSYEFLGQAQPWIRTWTELERPCVQFRAYPYSLCGIGALFDDLLQALLNRVKMTGKRSLPAN